MRNRVSGNGLVRADSPTLRGTRAFINMHAQAENAGDALVLRELIQLVSSRVQTELYLGNWPEDFVRQLRVSDTAAVTAHRGRKAFSIVNDVIRARMSGQRCYYFLTAGAPHGERTIRQFVLDLIRVCWLAVLAASGVLICQVGVSFENIGPRHARILRWRSRLLHASVPRDRFSHSYMQELGIRTTGIMPDVTLNLFRTPTTPYEQPRKQIAFSFRVDKYPAICERLCEIVKDVCEASREDIEFVFVAQVRRDIAFMKELAKVGSTAAPGRVTFADCHQDIDEAFAIYRRCSTVLSNRLHALLPALKEGASPVAMLMPGLDPKIAGVFESIGLQEQVLDLSTAKFKQIQGHMRPIAFDGRAVAEELNQFFDGLLARA